MKNRQRRYKAIIIGAGKIAAGFDTPQSKKILTHAHALKKHPATDLVGFFDIDRLAAGQAAKKWGCQSFNSFADAIANKPDIAIVCVSSEHHYVVLRQLAKFKLKLVICEKPLTDNLADSERIIKIYKKAGIPILVNYSRRFDFVVRRIRQEIASGRYGKVLAAYGIYNKGVLNSGSHLIDLSRFLFGEVKTAKSFYRSYDYKKNDPSVAGFLEFEKCSQFHLIIGDSRLYKIWELNVLLEKGSLNFVESGIFLEKRGIKDDEIYAGYKILSKVKIFKTKLDRVMLEMIKNAVGYLNRSALLLCDAEEAFKDQKICLALMKNK
jgi:predicted dehydrogenase